MARLAGVLWIITLGISIKFRCQCLSRLWYEVLLIFFYRAWETVQTLPTKKLSHEPVMKLMSVAMWLAYALEKDKRPCEAYKVLSDALELRRLRYLSSSSNTFDASQLDRSVNEDERRMVIAISLKLFSLLHAHDLKVNVRNEEQKWLATAYFEFRHLLHAKDLEDPTFKETQFVSSQIVKSLIPKYPRLKFHTNLGSETTQVSNQRSKEIAEFLPPWANLTEQDALAMPLQAIGRFTEDHEHLMFASELYDLATILYLHPTHRGMTVAKENTSHFLHALNANVRVLTLLASWQNGRDREIFLNSAFKLLEINEQLESNWQATENVPEHCYFLDIWGMLLLLVNEPGQAIAKFRQAFEIAKAQGIPEEQQTAKEAIKFAQRQLDRKNALEHMAYLPDEIENLIYRGLRNVIRRMLY
ncbi:hypothetical protein DFH11DRAFT_286343 [Phellopilus nigrolimitatus]|nr:hypothetical protein DFH11DRAFT_286343 [Phellopilus nigrolimitatus]